MQVKMQRLFNQQPPRPVRGGGRGAGPAAPPVRRPRPRRYPDVSIAELMASPSRLQMPLIHPEKENNGLWGAWYNYSMVSDEMKLTWWGDFVAVPPYKGRVYGLGSAHCYYGDSTPSTSTAIPRTMQLETRVTFSEGNMSSMQGSINSMQGNINSMATEIAAIMEASRMLLEANGIDPSVVLKSTTTNPAEPAQEATPEQQSPTLNRQTQAPATTPINLGDMEPQSFGGYFENDLNQ
ncbi:hypothetical protein HID58_055636 [Brassica napus]|uniref:Uncharacterized protein n=3 Tax=Brassica TaxID=3705 RepID=A0ABQ8AKW8_BRANA|nr:hypothetical protein HID58_055636 [Brassica napus]